MHVVAVVFHRRKELKNPYYTVKYLTGQQYGEVCWSDKVVVVVVVVADAEAPLRFSVYYPQLVPVMNAGLGWMHLQLKSFNR